MNCTNFLEEKKILSNKQSQCFTFFQFRNNSLWWYIDCFSVLILMKNTIYCSLKFIVWSIYILSDVAYFSRGASFMPKCVEQFVKKENITINLTFTFISRKRVVIIQFGLKPSSFVKEKKYSLRVIIDLPSESNDSDMINIDRLAEVITL